MQKKKKIKARVNYNKECRFGSKECYEIHKVTIERIFFLMNQQWQPKINMWLKHHGLKIDARKMGRNAPDCTFYSLSDRSRRQIEKL